MSTKDILSLFALPLIFFLAHGESMAYYPPKPTGPFNIGKTVHYLTDTSRKEELSRTNGHREITCFIYYPTQQDNPGEKIGPTLKLSADLFHDTPQIFEILDQVKAWGQPNAPLLETNAKFPVIFFSHGLGDPVIFYTSFLEDLASHGYVVIAVQHTYGCEPAVLAHNKIIHMPAELAQFNKEIAGTIEEVLDREQDTWIQDILFTLDSLKNNTKVTDSSAHLANKIDFQRIGIFGHSFGASAAVAVSRLRNDIRAVVNLDGVLWGSDWNARVTTPTLFIMAGKQPSKELVAQAGFSDDQWQRMMSRDPAPIYEAMKCDAFYITIKEADHMTFNDLYYIKSLGHEKNSLRANEIALTRSLLLDFFDLYLRDKSSVILNQSCEFGDYTLTKKENRLPMTEMYYATGNQMKFDEAQEFFKKNMPQVTLKQCDKDFDEIQTLDQEAIALNKAHQAWNYLKKPVLVDDAGIYFERYHKFPGTLTKFIFKGLGYDGILRLVDHNNPATFKLVLVFMYGPDKHQLFQAEGHGKIIHTNKLERVYEGGPFDPLFVPNGQTKTYDELRHEGNFEQYNYRVQGLKKFASWFQLHTSALPNND